MQLADAARGQSHVDASEALSHREFTLRNFAGPAAFMKPLVREGKWILERLHAARIRGDGIAGVGIGSVETFIGGTGITAASVGARLAAQLVLSHDVRCQEWRQHGCRRERSRTRAQKFSS